MFGNKKREEELNMLTMRATSCALEIQTHLSEYDSKEGFTLTLHIGIGMIDLFSHIKKKKKSNSPFRSW